MSHFSNRSQLAALRGSSAVAADQTGGDRNWLWAYVGEQVTVYDVAGGRGYRDAEAVLGQRATIRFQTFELYRWGQRASAKPASSSATSPRPCRCTGPHRSRRGH